jgi:putative membrane protein
MQPPGSKGKTPTTDVTLHQLRRRKTEALRLCLAFVFATKHYLRGEDGINYADYHGVLPNYFLHYDEMVFNSHQTSMASTYAATKDGSVDPSRKDASSTRSGSSTPDPARPDATKRVRPKRSKPQLANQSTPLLAGAHRSIEIPYADEVSLPLPLVLVALLRLRFFHESTLIFLLQNCP